MPRKIKAKLNEKLTLDLLYEAFKRAAKGKYDKKEVLLFEKNLEVNLSNILNKLENRTYKPGKYRCFTIYEPKERLIKSQSFKDRVVHQFIVEEYIKPYMIPRFINNTFACLPNKGAHRAIKTLQKDMRKMKKAYGSYYVLKGDIHKYFYSIDKNILYNIIKKYTDDSFLLWLFKIFIFDDKEEKGIPIGNYTSQYFANIYLNELDQYVKKELHVKYYYRYMDDFVILCKDKNEAKTLLNYIDTFIQKKLNLKLNPKTRIFPSKFGVNFCGYITHEYYILLRKRCIKNLKRLKKRKKLNLKNFKGHLIHANTYRLIQYLNKEDNEK